MTNTNTVADLALAIPRSIPVLERLRIDYCCHGGQPIEQACRDAGVTADELLKLIAQEPVGGEEQSWEGAPLTAVIRFIVETHHAYTRTTLGTLQTLATKVAQAHGQRHPELANVERLVHELTADLLPHMMKEEQILFPYVEEMEKAQIAGSEVAPPFFGTVRNPIRMMLAEHETVGEKLAEVRGETKDYAIPEDACTSFKAFYKLFVEFEQDIHRHIHIENNVLFPRVLTMEINALQATGAAW
jgi:regulator of cell morphogenesis and NO signaling